MSTNTTMKDEPSCFGIVTHSKSGTVSAGRICPHKEHNDLDHQYSAKTDNKISKLHEILNKIFDLADNDLITVDRDSVINDYTFNEEFANKLEDVDKHLIRLQKQCDKKVNLMHERVQKFKDEKLEQKDLCVILDTLEGWCRDLHKVESTLWFNVETMLHGY